MTPIITRTAQVLLWKTAPILCNDTKDSYLCIEIFSSVNSEGISGCVLLSKQDIRRATTDILDLFLIKFTVKTNVNVDRFD